MSQFIATDINQGLSRRQVHERLRTYGENAVFKKKRSRPIIAFVKKFQSPLLILLITVSIVSFFIGQSTNATILLFMVGLSVTLDFLNTYKSEKAVQELTSRVVTTATILRGGKRHEVPLKDIVPGDIVYLSAGDVVPADCLVVQSDDFFVNQSTLTGESFPVERAPVPAAETPERLSFEMRSAVFMGTSAVTGFATVQVLRTGRATEFGKIADRLSKTEPETDFEKNIKTFSWFIMRVTFFMVSFVFIVNMIAHKVSSFDAFVFSVAIAVGLTPELLPVIISVSLSHGSIKMAKKDVIVKNLSSIQNFGSMNVLCTDKTGTLTEDRIAVMKCLDGYGRPSDKVLLYAYLNSMYHTGVQNPLDTAVKDYKKLSIKEYKKIDEIPFDFSRRRQSVVVQSGAHRLLISKGAPEQIFSVCSHYQDGQRTVALQGAVTKKVQTQFSSLSAEGFRVLAVAVRTISGVGQVYSRDVERDLTLIGFIALLDPPKESAAEAIKEFEELGIEVKILTGDNEVLTQKICRDIRVPIKGVYTGVEIAALNDKQLQRAVLSATIFARVSPEQKERIIQSLRKANSVVGYLGDGINDAPALKAADVGISVNNAVDVAKETADIILLRKSLRVLKDGVVEGRKTFHNSLKYILMGLSSNFGNMFSMMGASVFLPFLPMLPSQILFNNFLYDSSQITLPSDNVDAEAIRKPTTWSFKFIKRYMLTFGLISSAFDFLTFYVLYWGFGLANEAFQAGWFIESIATQVFVIYVIRTKKIPFLQSSPSRLLVFNTVLAVAIAWIVPFTPLGAILSFRPLPAFILAIIAGFVILYLLLVEITKRVFYRFQVNN